MVAAPSSAFGQGPTPSQGRTQALRTFRATHYLSTRRNIQAECGMTTGGPGTGRRCALRGLRDQAFGAGCRWEFPRDRWAFAWWLVR